MRKSYPLNVILTFDLMIVALATYRKYFIPSMLFMIVMGLISAERARVKGRLNQLKDDVNGIKERP